jgi:AraC-like DNA-binding protein
LIYEDIDGVSVSGIAEKFELSRRTFYRKCTEYDMRPGVVIREIRIQTAVKAMEKDGISMAEAAKRVGYSPNHLRRLLDEERPSVQET